MYKGKREDPVHPLDRHFENYKIFYSTRLEEMTYGELISYWAERLDWSADLDHQTMKNVLKIAKSVI